MRKIIKSACAIVLSAAILLSFVPVSPVVIIADATGNSVEFAGGSGTESNPYLISTSEHLNNVRNYLGAHFKLLNDIIFFESAFVENGAFYNNGSGWLPIGSGSTPFTGVFDGNMKKIENLSIVGMQDYTGLFAANAGTIKNLDVTAKITTTYSYTGGIAGKNAGKIDGCSFAGEIIGSFAVGGIVGENNKSVSECTNRGDISGSDSCIGGISGRQSGSSALIQYCINYGIVGSADTVNHYGYAGGILGAGEGSIVHCSSYGMVQGDTAGGIAGKLERNIAYGNVSYCYNTGEIRGVSSASTCGGIVGSQSYTSIKYCYNSGSVGDGKANKCGGIAGYLAAGVSTEIINCYNTGKVQGYYVGGIFGRNTNFQNVIKYCYNIGPIESQSGLKGGIGGRYVGGITKCYYLNDISEGACHAKGDSYYSYDAAACALEEMKKQTTFSVFDFENTWSISEHVNNGFPYMRMVLPINREGYVAPEQDDPEVEVSTNMVAQQVGNIQMGPYALKGASISVLGYEISLIDLEGEMSLEICDNLKIVADTDNTIKVLVGFDQSADANISGSNNSTQYWSESYREVKSLYQEITGKKVDTTRLWNRFSSMRGKLKKISAGMVVDVKAELAGYLEFRYEDGTLIFAEGGIIAAFDANTSLRSYYGPCYVALGIEAGVHGSLIFTNEDNEINPEITISPEFTIAAGGGIGTRSTYAQIDAYGTLSAKIASAAEDPFAAGIELGVRWMGYIVGKEIFSGSKEFVKTELYPNFGDPWEVSLLSLTPDVDVSNSAVYNELINSAKPVGRDYLRTSCFLRNQENYSNASFVKQNAYPLSAPELVSFDDDTMLLIWIDDTGEKTNENMCSIMYAYFDGSNWSEPAVIYEDGTANDMPSVYSDGRYAYIVWQMATRTFGSGEETSNMLQGFDLYATVFDRQTQTFTEPYPINSQSNTTFEFNPVIYGENGVYTVAWLENSDNNVYQMSGENRLRTSSFNLNGELLKTQDIQASEGMFTGLTLGDECVYYALLEDGSNNLYMHESTSTLCAQSVTAFDYKGGLLFYSTPTGFYGFDGQAVLMYENIGVLDDFRVDYNNGNYVLCTAVLNMDFTKDLYYSTLTSGEWSDLEVYSKSGKYIRDYSPTLKSNGTVHVAFNYLEQDFQKATIVVGQCADEVDVSVEYVDFDDIQLDAGNVDLKIGIKNEGSKVVQAFMVSVLDNNGINVYLQEVSAELPSFGNCEIAVNYILPNGYNDEVYTVHVLPVGYSDMNEANNAASTTFTCIHDYSGAWEIIREPSQSANGVKVLRCTKCKDVVKEQEIMQLKFAGASLFLQHNLAIRYKVDKTLFEDAGYTDPYVVFELNGVQTKVSSYTVSEGRYVFAFRNIAPNQMNDTISATLFATYNGVKYASAVREYSVAEYCYNMLDQYAGDEYGKLRTLLVDLLHYGAASQAYTGYRTDAFVNALLTETQMLWGTSGDPVMDTVLDTTYRTVDNPKVIWKGAGLNLQESVAIRLKFVAESVDGLSVKIEGEQSIWTISSNEFVEDDGVYYVYFTGLNAGQMRKSIYVTMLDGDTPVSDTVCYSIGSYAYEKQNSTIVGLPELVKAMMKYGDSACAYVS